MINKLKVQDEVTTPEGQGIVAGLVDDGQIEVRYPSQGRRLQIWPRDAVTKVEGQPNGTVLETTITEQVAGPDAYRQAREQGLTPPVDMSTFGEEALTDKPQAQRSTLAQMVAKGDDVPRGSSGRKLSGSALARHLAKQQREGS